VVKNALADPDLSFPIFYFPKFHLFLPCLDRPNLLLALRLKTYTLNLRP